MSFVPGDGFYHDPLERANRLLGFHEAWVRRGIGQDHFAVKPNATIDSLTGLLDTLDLWFPSWRAQ